jgi:DNA-binding MarR family transcriptional regulator
LKKKPALESPASARSPEEWAVTEILRCAEHLGASFAEALKPFDVSFTQYCALRILRGEPEGLASSAIGERMFTRDSDITRLVDRLVARGLLERSRDSADRRVVLCRLTPAGTELVGRLEGATLELAAQQCAGVKPKRIRRLIETLRQLRNAPDE